ARARRRSDSGLASAACGTHTRTRTIGTRTTRTIGTNAMHQVLKTIDAHVAGEPLRLIVDGAPRPIGKTMAQKRDWMKRHADGLRRTIVLEPRGHRDMCAAMLTEPVAPGSDAGVIFLHNDGYPAISGHGIVAV